MMLQSSTTWRMGVTGLILALGLVFAVGCKDERPAGRGTADKTGNAVPQEPTIELLFTYGSEKKNWINEVTDTFNREGHKIANGKRIRVISDPMGSGESKDEILAETKQAHLWSPASAVFVKLGNAESQIKGRPLIGPTQDLVLSPVVIAMWKPMAEALGWPNKPVGWCDVLNLAKDPQGWATLGKPEFGTFKFGHTHPEYSNSGLISILAEIYAGAGKVKDLNVQDLHNPAVGQFLRDIESSVLHYGKSTGFFGDTMFDNGPQYLSAAVLYENMVVESGNKNLAAPIVAIYPKEGTFWSDHPIGIVERPWVTEEHKEAAKIYIDYLRAKPQQQKALQFGFRPAEGELGAPLDAAHGVDPQQPRTILELPSATVINGAIELWRANKKGANIVLVFDKSGSMNADGKIAAAREGAKDLVRMLGDSDSMALVPFSSRVTLIKGGEMSTARAPLLRSLDNLLPDGNTHLYEAIEVAYQHLLQNPMPGKISAIVVLTDGEDNGDKVNFAQLMSRVHGDAERAHFRIFTIGYGSSARLDVLKQLAKETKAAFYEGKLQNIRNVFKDIATFF